MACLPCACLCLLLSYAPIAHLTWHPKGLLRVWGVLDFAGGTVVHSTWPNARL